MSEVADSNYNLLHHVPSVGTLHLLMKLFYCKHLKSIVQETT